MSDPSDIRDNDGDIRDDDGDIRDGVADERDRAADARDRAGDERDDVLDLRDRTGTTRDGIGDDRDQAGDERDHAGALRDDAADARDRTAEAFEAMHGLRSPGTARARRDAAADRKQASDDRRAGAGERCEAELDRGAALADRLAGARQRTIAETDRDVASHDRDAGASERIEAELDRANAHADRDASARDRDDASVDTLTRVSRRGAGFLALDREVARSRRGGHALLVGFIDVDGLKTINDTEGHAAGDRVLVDVAAALRANLRAYDLIFRYGGDEFVCAMQGVGTEFGQSRIALVNRVLAAEPAKASISVGFAELRPMDSTVEVVERADAALYRLRHAGEPVQLEMG